MNLLTTYEDPCSSLYGSWGKDATLLSLEFIIPLVAGHVFPGPWLWKLILSPHEAGHIFQTHLQRQVRTVSPRTLGFCAIQVLVRTLLYGMFLFLCQITTLLILAVFLLWLTCTTVTLFPHFLLSLSKWCWLHGVVSCALRIQPRLGELKDVDSQSHIWRYMNVEGYRNSVFWKIIHARDSLGVYTVQDILRTQRNCGMSKTWCLPSAITLN